MSPIIKLADSANDVIYDTSISRLVIWDLLIGANGIFL